MKLPQDFKEKMKNILGDEYDDFIKSLDQDRFYGLRVNTLKISVEDFLKISPFELTPIKWTEDGFYYNKNESPGKDPYYYVGLYYIQEPSAMLPGNIIDAREGERILDLCAAPGGKSVQILAGLKGKGLLVSNDISPKRVKALIKNVELVGAKNVVVTNDTPENLAQCFYEYFDKILVDAPCSGEGMFRKDSDAIRSYNKFKNEECSKMQINILKEAHKMLRKGGRLVYSTCTFDPLENEITIDKFTNEYKEYRILKIDRVDGIDKAKKEFYHGDQEIENAVRLWPHKLKGEGHFVAMLQKGEDELGGNNCKEDDIKYINLDKKHIEAFRDFQKENLNIELKGIFKREGNSLYMVPKGLPSMDNIKVVKYGWYLGDFRNYKFEPSNSLIISLNSDDIKNTISLPYNSCELIRYLKGETLIRREKDNGYVGMLLDGFTLGWAKQQDYILKNLYPKGWRKIN
ncbi:MAG: RsmB/NOP family class I SAM-dependent RNA methyltransferase [Clostridiales bacterium]|nr:RsmB/NOP family class I SAM-dependent RNA methyltransferase [Clostridiales bacterium]